MNGACRFIMLTNILSLITKYRQGDGPREDRSGGLRYTRASDEVYSTFNYIETSLLYGTPM